MGTTRRDIVIGLNARRNGASVAMRLRRCASPSASPRIARSIAMRMSPLPGRTTSQQHRKLSRAELSRSHDFPRAAGPSRAATSSRAPEQTEALSSSVRTQSAAGLRAQKPLDRNFRDQRERANAFGEEPHKARQQVVPAAFTPKPAWKWRQSRIVALKASSGCKKRDATKGYDIHLP
jgi:hypothetical protein